MVLLSVQEGSSSCLSRHMLCMRRLSPSQINLAQRSLHAQLSLETHPCAKLVFPHSNPRPHIPFATCSSLYLASQKSDLKATQHLALPAPSSSLPLLSDPLTFTASTGNHHCTPVTLAVFCWQTGYRTSVHKTRTVSSHHSSAVSQLPFIETSNVFRDTYLCQNHDKEAQSARRYKSFPSIWL